MRFTQRGLMAVDPNPTLLQDAAVATGNGALMLTKGLPVALMEVTIATTATVLFEGTTDNDPAVGSGTWRAIDAVNMVAGTRAATVTASAMVQVPCSGLSAVRARISAWTAGAVTVRGRMAPGPIVVV